MRLLVLYVYRYETQILHYSRQFGKHPRSVLSGYEDNPPTMEMLRRAFTIPDVTGIELVGTWDIRADNVKEMRSALGDAGWQCVSILPDLFTQPIYGKGALSNSDPIRRRHAIDNSRVMCDAALELECQLINLWPGQDGFDYCFPRTMRRNVSTNAAPFVSWPGPIRSLRFALEYKPKEPRTHSYIARMADPFLLADQTGIDDSA